MRARGGGDDDDDEGGGGGDDDGRSGRRGSVSTRRGASSAAAAASAAAGAASDIFAGTCGGVAVVLVGHPFDTLKVRLQTQPQARGTAARPVYSGALDCLAKTLRWEGPRGLYRGVTSPLAGQMFLRATVFGAFGRAKDMLGARRARAAAAAASQTSGGGVGSVGVHLKTVDFFAAGALTGAAISVWEAPIDLFKSQLQVQVIRARTTPGYKPPFTSVPECALATLRTSGLRGPFQGFGITLARNIPANAAFLGSFEWLKRRLSTHAGLDAPTWRQSLVAGGIAGIAYWVSIFPLDVVKSTMQADALVREQRVYRTIAIAVRRLWAEGGLPRFFRGFTPCLARSVPANAAMFFTVDAARNFAMSGMRVQPARGEKR